MSKRMTDSLESTTNLMPFPGDNLNPEEKEKEDLTEEEEKCWKDRGLPVELQKGLESLRVNQDLTDITLNVEGHDFHCHRVILAAASEYFRAMFCSGLKESREEHVQIKGVDRDTMSFLLEYTYTSSIHLTPANVERILDGACHFQFLRVVDACIAFLGKSLQLENCIGILNLAESHALSPLITLAENYITSNFNQVVQLPDFLELPAASMEIILQMDNLDMKSEESVFESLMLWMRARQDERFPLLPKLLAHVRLPLLDPAYFVEKVESDELIRHCSQVFPLMQEVRRYHLSGKEVVSERTKPRLQHFLSEVFLIIGGCTKDERFISTVTCLDPLRRSRLEVARLPFTEMENESHNRKWVEFACITFRNELYISGGKDTQHEVWKYNGALDKWIQIEHLLTPRWRHKMAVHGGRVYALGGFDGSQRLASVEAYDPFHNRWTQVTPLREGVSSFAAATFDRWIYVIGGGPNGRMASDVVQCWEPGTDQWELRASLPMETKCTCAVTFKDSIYIVGGAMHAMYSYSPLSDSWSLVARLGERASCAIAACNNKLFITGGRDNNNQVISTVMCWDVEREQLTEECALPLGVSHHGSVTLMKSYTHIQKISPEESH